MVVIDTPDIKINQVAPLYDLTAYCIGATMGILYNYRAENTERLRPLKNEPFILMPKHQNYLDIPLEQYLLLTEINRRGNWVMKEELLKYRFLGITLEHFGAITIPRLKEYEDKLREAREARRTDEMRTLMTYLKGAREKAYKAIEMVLQEGGIPVLHPETTRNGGVTIPGVLQKLTKLKDVDGNPPYFVPLDIHYEDIKTLDTEIVLKVGNPIQTRNWKELEDRLVEDIEVLEKAA